MARNKCLTIVLVLIIIGAFVFDLLPMMADGANFTITFYNEVGDPVGVPFALVPYGIITDGPGGQEVVTFKIEVFTYTDDPAVGWCDFEVNLKVHYVIGDNIPPETQITNEQRLWGIRTTVGNWENGRSQSTSPLFYVHDVIGNVPDEVTFYMEFSGRFWFYHTVDVMSSNPVGSGDMSPHTITMYHDAYTYDVWFGT